MRLFISHGADPGDWFIVEPREGRTTRSVAGTDITPEMAVESLMAAGRTVYEVDAIPNGHGVYRLMPFGHREAT